MMVQDSPIFFPYFCFFNCFCKQKKDLQDLKMISDIVSIATGDKNTIATCETKNLDAQMAQLGSRRPEKADQIERLRNTMKV